MVERVDEARWRAVGLARELALLGASCMLQLPADEIAEPERGFPGAEPRWRALGDRLHAHLSASEETLAPADAALRARLCGELKLTPAEFWLVMLAIAAELHVDASAALSILAEDERVGLPTPSSAARLLVAALGERYDDALRAGLEHAGPRRLELLEALEPGAGRPRVTAALRLTAGELERLLEPEAELGGCEREHDLEVELEPPGEVPVHDAALVAGAARLLDACRLVALRSDSGRAARQLALDLACVLAVPVAFVGVGDRLPSQASLERFIGRALPVIDLRGWPSDRPLPRAPLERIAAKLPALLVLVGERADCGRLTSFEAPALDERESRRVWTQVLADREHAHELARRFRVDLCEARRAASEAGERTMLGGDARPATAEEIAVVLRSRGARRMGRMVTHLRGQARLHELVVPDSIRAQLDDIVGWRRAAAVVEAALRERQGSDRLGRGLTCLFSGQPGTGKTFAAQCLATELGLNLYRIDLSQVVSKWLGETEKALAQVFDEAEAGHGVLLFDEADALFGKRTEVKDAHDRYANVEVGYLLQRMESFTGIAILTTNLRSNIDPAFIRRLRFVIEFAMPDADRRLQLWEQALPPARMRAPELEQALVCFAERFRLAGGHIHNIGLAAAHLAAAEQQQLAPRHLVRATFRELEKAGLARSAADFGPLAQWLEPEERERRRQRRNSEPGAKLRLALREVGS